MKISLSTESKESLELLRKEVNSWLTGASKAISQLETMKADEEKLNDQVAKTETSVSYEDGQGVQSLETKRSQLGLLRGRIERLEAANAPMLEDLKEKLRNVHDTLAAATDPVYRAIVVDLARILLPFTGGWSSSLRLACQTNYATAFAHFYMMRRYGLSSNPIADCRQVIRIADALLDGKDIMPFAVETPPAKIPYKFPWER